MDDIHITCVAFHGEKTPLDLQSLIESCVQILQSILGSRHTDLFTPYTPYQIHATMIGLETKLINHELYSHWAVNNDRENHQPININTLIKSLSLLMDSSFLIRFCGYKKAHCSCTGEEFRGWNCPTSSGEFHSCGRTGYEGSFYGFSSGPVMITGWPITSLSKKETFPHTLYAFRKECEKAGFIDKYHSRSRPYWRDDDCYLKIGTFSGGIKDLPSVIQRMREFMAHLDPVIIELAHEQVEIILYRESSLSKKSIIKKISLLEAINKPDSLGQMFEYVKKHKTTGYN